VVTKRLGQRKDPGPRLDVEKGATWLQTMLQEQDDPKRGRAGRGDEARSVACRLKTSEGNSAGTGRA